MTCISYEECRSSCSYPVNLVYQTSFRNGSITDSCSKYDTRKNYAFTTYDPCLKCVNKNTGMASIVGDGLQIRFPTATGSSQTFWTRVGANAGSSCKAVSSCLGDCQNDNSCCPSIGNVYKGYMDVWVYFPEEDKTQINTCNYDFDKKMPRTSPFFHGGKLFGVCSSKCPTGNTKNGDYNTDWTIRIMFREQGRLVLLYSVPADQPFLLEPVPSQIRLWCCPNGDCSRLSSNSTDQYWFATTDTRLHAYRLAEYTFNDTDEISCCSQYKWPDGSVNPIDQVLRYGAWNFLRMEWDVDRGSVRVYHTWTNDETTPTFTPSHMDIVIDTPDGSIPFTSKQPARTVYFQPFYGGSTTDWVPTSVNDSCVPTSTETPTLVFGDVSVFSHT
jgi:hypothetical protein